MASSSSTRYLSPVKWAGSKSKEMKKIRSIISGSDLKICEPFLGIGVVSALLGQDGGCIGNDLNLDLIGLFRHHQDLKFQKEARVLLTKDNMRNKEFFYEMRGELDLLEPGSLERAIKFFFLQNCAHFGLYRIGAKNNYTSTWHFFDKEPRVDERLSWLKKLTDKFSVLENLDYREFLTKHEERISGMDLVFIDPPYLNASHKDYSVGKSEFTEEDFSWLDDYCGRISKKFGVQSIICNYSSENYDRIYLNKDEVVSFHSTRSMRMKDGPYTTRESIYVLYGFGNSLL